MKFHACLIALAVVICTNANATKLLTPELNSCDSWINERTRRDTQVQQFWVLGFLSGINVEASATAGAPDFLRSIDAGAVWASIDTYCRAHPLDSVSRAALAITTELIQRAKRTHR